VSSPRAERSFILAAAVAGFLLTAGAADGEDAPSPFAEALDEAVAAARAGDREKAAAMLLELSEEYPDEPAAFYNLAMTYEFDRDGNRYRGDTLALAASYYQRALALDPLFTPARLNIAVIWHRLGYLEEAAREYRLVVKGGGEFGRRAENNLALVLKAERRPEEAEALLTKSEAPYEDASRVRLLALLAEDAGDVGRAIRLWKRALALDEDPALSALAFKHLQALRGY
jgi:tetratricopeptide (TPR) repeat protein